MLGTRFGGNGDLLTFAVKATQQIAGKRVPRVIDPAHRPVITGAVRVSDEADGGKAAGSISRTPRLVGRLMRRRFVWDGWGKGPDPNLNSQLSEVFGTTGLSAGLLPMLGMGRDIPNGKMKLRAGRLDVHWKRRKSGPYFDRARRVSRHFAHQLGARFVDDPLWYVNRLITHPLGGCPMGRHEREGVVNVDGGVFGYPGLTIADGSVIPGPVGANPSVTIAALADRFAERLAILGRQPKQPDPAATPRRIASHAVDLAEGRTGRDG